MAARRVGANNGTRFAFPVISGLLLVVLVVVLFEAFGGIPLMSSPGHRPGATLGNRNLAARVACLSLPLLWYQLVLAKRNIAHCIFAVIVASAVAVIVISRSRGAFVVACAQLIAIPMAARWWVDKPIVPSVRRASLLWAMAVAIGVTSAVVLPNQLRWSASDLIFSAKRVSDFRTGSGRGRVIQAETTMRMIGATGLRGVGPGNWSTWYPGYAAPGDPSVRLGSFYPAPLIPRNDILGFLAEFGLFGFALAVASIIALLAETAAMIRQPDVSQRYLGLLIVAILIANFLLGLFDSVLRVATTVGLSAIVVGLALGASAQNISPLTERRPGSAAIRRLVVLAYACGALALARGAWQDFAALRIITAAHTVGDMYRAVSAAPNNIEAQMLLGYVLIGVKRCDLAQPHLTQVARLEPYSLAVKALQKQCPGWSSGFRGGSGSVSE
jgi:O-antigen ligase